MRNSPRIAPFPPEQLRTRHVKNLPPIPPRDNIFLAIRLHEMRPDIRLGRQHAREPVLACLCIVLAVDPPLLLECEVGLEEVEKVG